MTEEIQTLLALPLPTLALLTGGYLSYRLAYTGRDGAHSTVDVVFISVAFAFITRLAATFLSERFEGIVWQNIMGVLIALCVAAAWRKVGQRLVTRSLRLSRVSVSDRHKTAWDTMLSEDHRVTAALLVKKTDGTMLFCEQLHSFEREPDGPCILGHDASIAMYATAVKFFGDEEWSEQDLRTEDGAIVMTYIPANQISEIRLWRNR